MLHQGLSLHFPLLFDTLPCREQVPGSGSALQGGAPEGGEVESKWVDLLIKSFVKVRRVSRMHAHTHTHTQSCLHVCVCVYKVCVLMCVCVCAC